MKIVTSLIVTFFCLPLTYAQVGINTVTPNALFEVRSSNQATPSNTDGMLIPKIDEFPATNPSSNQDGMLVYVTGNSTPEKGFYSWDTITNAWRPIGIAVFEAIDEGNGIGYIIKGRNPLHYGAIGENAFDLSITYGPSTTRGATGRNSFAAGNRTTASNEASVALGYLTNATGFSSFATGMNTTASGNLSTSLGRETIASAFGAFAAGNETTASGTYAIALGDNTVASERGSFSAGLQSQANGAYSFAYGNQSMANKDYSFAFGNNSVAEERFAVAVGDATLSTAWGSVALGFRTVSKSLGSISLGIYNVGLGGAYPAYFIVPTDPILEVGNGTSYTNRSNALTILKNGTITAPSFDIAEITDDKALITKEYLDNPEASIAATLSTSWSAYNATYTTPGYYKSLGRVYLEGLLRKTGSFVSGEIIFTLPAGYRPATRKLCSGVQSGGATLRIDILANGEVRYMDGDNGIGDFISLEGISFKTN